MSSTSTSFVPARTNHVLHLILTIITFGLWAPVWLIVALINANRTVPVHSITTGFMPERPLFYPPAQAVGQVPYIPGPPPPPQDGPMRTTHEKACPGCGKRVTWWKHPEDAINPIGLWHHDDERDDEVCNMRSE